MKISFLKLAVLFLLCFKSFAQEKEIDVVANLVDGNYVISAKNNSDERKEIKIFVTSTEFKVGPPVVKLVNKGETADFITVKPVKGKMPKFSYGSSFVSKPTDEELAVKNDKLKSHIGLATDDLSKGVVIFTKDGCPRCERTLNHLLKKDSNFKFYNTSESPEMNQLMWKTIKEKKASEKITMPVVLVNGKLSHSHADLEAFLNSIRP